MLTTAYIGSGVIFVLGTAAYIWASIRFHREQFPKQATNHDDELSPGN